MFPSFNNDVPCQICDDENKAGDEVEIILDGVRQEICSGCKIVEKGNPVIEGVLEASIFDQQSITFFHVIKKRVPDICMHCGQESLSAYLICNEKQRQFRDHEIASVQNVFSEFSWGTN